MEHIKEIMNQVGERLAQSAQSDLVVGVPIELGGVTVVPLSRVSLGLGAGGGSGTGESPHKGRHPGGTGTGGATGGGAKVRPVAVAVFTADGVEILRIPERKGRLDKLLDQLPPLVEKISAAVK
jgi:uncharacterized spore protein YtfJ